MTTKKEPGAVGEIAFTVQVFREGKLFVAHAPELDVSSAGETVEKAKIHQSLETAWRGPHSSAHFGADTT